jgi:DUF4097 and DUF4098 domain-containing protein YvlB
MASWVVDDVLRTVLEGVREVHVNVHAGEVAVRAGDCPSHLEVERLRGEPPVVEITDEVVEVRYPPSWTHWACGGVATVELTVPAPTDVTVRTVSGTVLLGGLLAEASVRTLSGDVVLDRPGGRVRVRTASGGLEVREPTASLRYNTLSGDVAIASSLSPAISGRTVSGEVVLDFVPQPAGEYELATVSGDVALRIPDDASIRVDARTLSGTLQAGFELEMQRRRVGRTMVGEIGAGHADLAVRTVSGDVAVLRPALV